MGRSLRSHPRTSGSAPRNPASCGGPAKLTARILPLLAAACSSAATLARPAPAAPASSSAPAALPAPRFPIEEYRLSNGLRVILAPDASLPTVTVMVRYDVGSRDEPDGLGGIAHLVEHLMFERSKHIPNGAFMSTLTAAGASEVNGSTSLDETLYHETVPAERLALALWMESDRMGFFLPALDQAALDQERTVVVTEMRTRYYDRPAGIAPFAVQEATFPPWHPYHFATAGSLEDLQRISLADVRAFAGTWYGPDNAILVLAGRLDTGPTRALVERYFATLPSRPPPARPALPELAKKGPTRIEIHANTDLDQLRLTWTHRHTTSPGTRPWTGSLPS